MMSIADLNAKPKASKPYTFPLRGTIVKLKLPEIAIADKSDCIKLVAKDLKQDQSMKLKEGKTFIFRNYVKGKSCLFLNAQAQVSMTANVEIPKAIQEKAQELICPKTPPRTEIKDIHLTSPISTVQGIVKKVSALKYFIISSHA